MDIAKCGPCGADYKFESDQSSLSQILSEPSESKSSNNTCHTGETPKRDSIYGKALRIGHASSSTSIAAAAREASLMNFIKNTQSEDYQSRKKCQYFPREKGTPSKLMMSPLRVSTPRIVSTPSNTPSKFAVPKHTPSNSCGTSSSMLLSPSKQLNRDIFSPVKFKASSFTPHKSKKEDTYHKLNLSSDEFIFSKLGTPTLQEILYAQEMKARNIVKSKEAQSKSHKAGWEDVEPELEELLSRQKLHDDDDYDYDDRRKYDARNPIAHLLSSPTSSEVSYHDINVTLPNTPTHARMCCQDLFMPIKN